MTRNKKIILAVIGGVVLLCAITCIIGVIAFVNFGQSVAQNVVEDPQEVRAMSDQIATFDPPPGVEPSASLRILGFDMVFYGDDSRDIVLVLMQMPIEGQLTDADFNRMRTAMEQQSGRRLQSVETLEDRPMTIRDQPARMVIQEGVDDDGNTFRQMMVGFQGRSGLAFLNISSPAAYWDQAAFEQTVESIR